MAEPTLDQALTDRVQDATARYLQVLDSLTDTGRAAPSVLPGWDRGHVVAHLARQGLATAAALDEVRRGQDPVLYASPSQREDDIETLAAAPLDELRAATLEAAGRCHRAIEAALHHDPAALAGRRVTVFPGSDRAMDVTELVRTRWREVEIHHADLDGGYGPADWPDDFTDHLLEVVVADRAPECDLLLVTPTRDVVVGAAGGLRVEGTAAGLAWWLLGRPAVPELTGRLPQLSPWVRRG
ncbi:maleylpyruvate isomerase family mycothiol-dependent enzyme [Nocardioides coralli]|uniref:maleylpyruvate isomerase family mycothiol-dependent enzyme n=1 Tax=Nocardioides coralli TaxID=2872154 RepID=UPI001CA411C8|nr:maleylpyruvate isomerase family mycothiol-dependent enzyme [Nocardioides coralli]QZY30653.1 maleylpyruvate isomerase family mycothiol-dependent enzyme [Nocardioides coralli]